MYSIFKFSIIRTFINKNCIIMACVMLNCLLFYHCISDDSHYQGITRSAHNSKKDSRHQVNIAVSETLCILIIVDLKKWVVDLLNFGSFFLKLFLIVMAQTKIISLFEMEQSERFCKQLKVAQYELEETIFSRLLCTQAVGWRKIHENESNIPVLPRSKLKFKKILNYLPFSDQSFLVW